MSNASINRPKSKSGAVKRKRTPRALKPGRGVVGYCVHGSSGKMVAAGFSTLKLIQALQAGLPVQELNDLQTTLNVPMDKLVPMLGISRATLHRRKAEGKLDPAESDRVVRFARLMGQALAVLESEETARQWLTSPQFG